ncbi:MAG: InlB B-repeat-containing protein, partial [Clostridia bacterium]|nr:InlB B-repeat-containing protein [Clostridia bacterium]
MSRFKRVISFVLTVVMLVGMMPQLGIGVSAASYDIVEDVHRAYKEGEKGYDGETKDRELKRLATITIKFNGGAYYYTWTNEDEDFCVPADELSIPEGNTSDIEIRLYHPNWGRDGDCETGRPTYRNYDDYIAVAYIDGVKVTNHKYHNLQALLLTIFYSTYKIVDDGNGNKTVYQLEAYNLINSGGTAKAYINPNSFIESEFDAPGIFGDSDTVDKWTCKCMWLSPEEVMEDTSKNGRLITLDAGPEGNGKTTTFALMTSDEDKYSYSRNILITNENVIRNILGFAPHAANNDGRIFIGWAEDYQGLDEGEPKANHGYGDVQDLYSDRNRFYKGESDTLYAIWGYPIMFDSDGGVYKDSEGYEYVSPTGNNNDEYLTYVADYGAHKGENTDPATMYRYVMPDWNGYILTKEGCRRVDNSQGYAYALVNADGKTFFTWEGYGENLTIPPKGGSTNADGSHNGYEWDDFRCVEADDKNNPYGIEFPEFVAIWEPSVTYHANAQHYTGSMEVEWLEWDYGHIYNYKDYMIKGSGYQKVNEDGEVIATFEGWNTKPDGTGYNYEPGKIINELSNSDPIVLYAQWSDKSYDATEGEWTVTLDPYGGQLGTLPSGTKGTVKGGMLVCPAEVGQTYAEIIGTLPTPTRTGFAFDGWWFEQDD